MYVSIDLLSLPRKQMFTEVRSEMRETPATIATITENSR